MKDIACKLAVIGAGPGGYVCAIRAGQLGIDTVIVEAKRLGGVCLNVGCIPSKALIHAGDEFERLRLAASGAGPLGFGAGAPTLDFMRTIAWKDGIVGRLTGGVGALLKKNKVKIVSGAAKFRDGKTLAVETETGLQIIRAEQIVIATGSAPVELPSLPFGGLVISSTQALSVSEIPRRLVVVGAGYIGLELGTAFAKLGSAVTIVEAEPRILPLYDSDLTRPIARKLAELGVKTLTSAKAKGLAPRGDALQVTTDGDHESRLPADKILVTVGRRPILDGWGREELALDLDGRYLRIDDQCRTSMRGIYAIGDVTGEPMLAHRAMAQGEMVAEIVAGHKRSWDKRAIPSVCFSDPEIVSVGATPDEARQGTYEILVGQFPFSANGRAMTRLAEDGFVRVVARADNQLVLGLQAVGREISELAAAFGLAIEMGATLEDIAGTIHAHPTMGEALQESALRALGRAIHI
jgi:dihydrolipoamide dehydrogenase